MLQSTIARSDCAILRLILLSLSDLRSVNLGVMISQCNAKASRCIVCLTRLNWQCSVCLCVFAIVFFCLSILCSGFFLNIKFWRVMQTYSANLKLLTLFVQFTVTSWCACQSYPWWLYFPCGFFKVIVMFLLNFLLQKMLNPMLDDMEKRVAVSSQILDRINK